jgi:hypothetical protein
VFIENKSVNFSKGHNHCDWPGLGEMGANLIPGGKIALLGLCMWLKKISTLFIELHTYEIRYVYIEMKSFQSSYGRVWHLEWWQRCNLACVAALRERRACMHETPCLAVFTRSPREREIWLVQNEKYANLCQNNHWLIA